MTKIEKAQPYLGISGIARHEQHAEIIDIAKRERIDELGHFVMVGVQSTTKTQVLDVENKRGVMWHPVGDNIAYAAESDSSGLTKPFVHCAFLKQNDLEVGTRNIMRRTSHYIKGLQFNGLSWVRHNYEPFMKEFKQTYPSQSIILQANGGVLNNHSPMELTEALKSLAVDYVLIDPSGGFGVEMDISKIRPYVDSLYQAQTSIGIGVAGGLSAKNIESVFGPLVKEFPGLSCDAEGRLRKGAEGETTLDMQAVEEYIVAWKGLVTSNTATS